MSNEAPAADTPETEAEAPVDAPRRKSGDETAAPRRRSEDADSAAAPQITVHAPELNAAAASGSVSPVARATPAAPAAPAQARTGNSSPVSVERRAKSAVLPVDESLPRRVSMAWKSQPEVAFTELGTRADDMKDMGTRPACVPTSFGWWRKGEEGGRGSPRSKPASRRVSVAQRTASRNLSTMPSIPLAVNDEDAYEVKETTITLSCEEIEVPVTTQWPLATVEQVRALCEETFEFLAKYPEYQLECHHQRPFGAEAEEPTKIVLEVLITGSRRSTTLTSEMATHMATDDLIALFQSSLRDMKIAVFKVCVLEFTRRIVEWDNVVTQEEREAEGGGEGEGEERADGDATHLEVPSPASPSRRKSSRFSVIGTTLASPASSVRKVSRGQLRASQNAIESIKKLTDCIKSMHGELRTVPECVFAEVLALLYTVIDSFSDDDESACLEESEEYLTFALRGFAIKEASPFFTQIFTAACDLFMVLCYVGCEAGGVLDGPAFEVICNQAKLPSNDSLEVSASASECMVVMCRTSRGLELFMKDHKTWCEWVGHALQTLQEEHVIPPDDWVYSMLVAALFRMWGIFAHENEECHAFFRENYEKLPLDFIVRTYQSETFSRDCDGDVDVITAACCAITGTFEVDAKTGCFPFQSEELENILLDLIVHCHADPDVLDQVCHCIAIVASKNLVAKSGSAILEAILRGVAKHKAHPRFLTNAFHSFSMFLRKNPGLQEILTLEALELIVSILKENPFSEILQENGLFLVGLMSRKVERNRVHLVKCGAVQLCKIAAGQFPANEVMKDHAKYATQALTKEPSFLQLW